MFLKSGIACLTIGLLFPWGSALSEPLSLNIADHSFAGVSAAPRSFMASVEPAAIAMPMSIALDDNALAAAQLLATQSRRLALVAAALLTAGDDDLLLPDEILTSPRLKSTVHGKSFSHVTVVSRTARSQHRADLRPRSAEPRKIAAPRKITEPSKVAEPRKIAEPRKVAGPRKIAEPRKVAGPRTKVDVRRVAQSRRIAEPHRSAEPPIIAGIGF